MEQKLIGENLGQDLSTLESYEGYYREGDRGKLRLYLSEPLVKETIKQLEDNIITQGVYLTEPIRQDARIVVIKFQKRIAPLLIIGSIVIAIGIGILGWQIFKAEEEVPLWAWLIGGGTLLYLVARR